MDSNPEELGRLYMIEGLTVEEIAGRLGCGATDGNLARDGRHMTLTSKDLDLLETVRACLNIGVALTSTRNGQGRPYLHLQWSDRAFYSWLVSIGLMPAKSLRLSALQIPEELFGDFLRGCIDGDGSIITYTDSCTAFKNPAYVYSRLFVTLASASRPFLEWIHVTVARLKGLRGAIVGTGLRPGRNPVWSLKYAKRDSIRLLNWLYYAPDVPCLARKRAKAKPFLCEA